MFKNLFLGNTNIDFYNKRNLLQKIFIVEIVIFLTVLICAAIGILNLNFSIDFTGGTTYQLTSEYSKSDIDEVLTNNILEVSRYQTYENNIKPVIDFYKQSNLLKVVDGEGSIIEINDEISGLIEGI